MYAILNKNIALRTFLKIPYCFYSKYSDELKGLTKEEFKILLLADAEHNIPDNELSRSLIERGLMSQCNKNEFQLSEWSKHQIFFNRAMPKMNIQITGKCNFNCKHCFNAKDNERLNYELTYEEIVNLLDQAKDCGIHSLTLTGGEPTIHKDIKKIIKAIVDRDMILSEFNTNGFLVNQEFLDFLHSINSNPTIKISFDGLGYHDQMRGFVGAEEDAIRSIKLSIANNFEVMAQVNVNKNNIQCMAKTIEYLDEIGVSIIRLIRTTEVPRWLKNGGECLGIEEYYDEMLKLAKIYISKPRKARVIMWQFLRIYPKTKIFSLEPISNVRDSQPICYGVRKLISIGANGNVYPCMQLSSGVEIFNIDYGNIKKTPLFNILQSESNYMKEICTSVKEKAEINGVCNKCKFYEYCGCGCPALTLSWLYMNTNTYSLTKHPDEWKCLFFNKRYDLKAIEALKGYKNASLPIKIL